MITKPLELESRLSPPPRDLDFVAWVNVGVVVVFFGLLGSRFILTPGIDIQMASGQSGSEKPPVINVSGASVVLSYSRDNLILFEGGMYYSLADLRKPMEAYIKAHPGAEMLARVDRRVSVQGFMDLRALADELGFSNVIMALEPTKANGAGN